MSYLDGVVGSRIYFTFKLLTEGLQFKPEWSHFSYGTFIKLFEGTGKENRYRAPGRAYEGYRFILTSINRSFLT